MRISAIKAQVKNPDRISVYIDGAYAFSLTQDQLLELKVRTGQELDDNQLTTLKQASDFGKAYSRVLNYLAVRPRAIKEIRDYCWRKQISPEDCETIVRRLTARGYLNDADFTKAWIDSRRLTKNISAKRLRLELRQKGVDDATIANMLAESDFNEVGSLQKLVAKKRRQSRYQDDQKLLQYLMRQGFGYEDCKQALSATNLL